MLFCKPEIITSTGPFWCSYHVRSLVDCLRLEIVDWRRQYESLAYRIHAQEHAGIEWGACKTTICAFARTVVQPPFLPDSHPLCPDENGQCLYGHLKCAGIQRGEKSMAYDERCYELAAAFLNYANEGERKILAQVIQDAIEHWLETAAPPREHAP